MASDAKEYKELTCKDFRADCDFMVRAKTEDELMRYCRDHACSVHGKCGDSPESREKIKSRIKNVFL